MTTTYDDGMTMGAARQRYFDANGFDGAYAERWVKLKAGPIPIYFPNAEGRRRAVRFHDLHHIATGYQTDWTGEAEIGGFEIGGGCGPFIWAWMLNLQAMALGLFMAPRALFRAFVRGRHAGTLYHQGEFQEAMLGRSVGDIRRQLGLDRATPAPGIGDVAAFITWSAASLAWTFAPLALLTWWLAG
ncbi:MAG TPA: hypothetical protein VL049_19825 [Candidatus Dormibacteraeota bacterium]|nr:hypothetical protein [Candidatus Dormibacteraeota bacterium]